MKAILKKMMSVISFSKVDKNIIEDADMGGPMLVIILFGFLLLLVSSRVKIIREEKSSLDSFMVLVSLGVLASSLC